MHVAVIGAGVVGASIGYRLAVGGADVTIVEAGEPGGETSMRSSAWLNGNDKPPLHYQKLNADGIEAHRQLGRDLGQAPWLHETGCVMFEANGPTAVHGRYVGSLARRVARLTAGGYPAELISVGRAAELEPTVDFSSGTTFAWFPRECWAHGPTLVRTLVDAAVARGARLLTRTRVVGIDGGRVSTAPVEPGVGDWPRLRAGDSAAHQATAAATSALEADLVVIAAGRFTDRVAALADIRVPLAPTCGLLAVTSPFANAPSRVVYCPGIHFRPDGDGRLVLQDEAIDRSVDPETPEPEPPDGAHELLRRAQRYVPGLADGRVDAVRVGIRPMPEDGYPILGLEGSVYIAVTHSGMTLGPLLGELVAGEILSGQPNPRLVPYRLARYQPLPR